MSTIKERPSLSHLYIKVPSIYETFQKTLLSTINIFLKKKKKKHNDVNNLSKLSSVLFILLWSHTKKKYKLYFYEAEHQDKH